MKIVLFSRPKADIIAADIVEIFAAIDRYGFEFAVNEEFADSIEPILCRTIAAENRYGATLCKESANAVMVCYGGDGTLLEGIHRLDGQQIPVIGINSGRLGFLSLAQRSEIGEVFCQIANNNLQIEQRKMLEVSCLINGEQQKLYALNEIAVQRLGATMISIDTNIDGKSVSKSNGDGVIIATPTGSTAYSMSAGGPIIAPSCNCTVLTPLSPHNLTLRPVVIAAESVISLKIHTRGNKALISADNRTFEIEDLSEVTIRSAERTISLAVPHNISFYDTLHNKMMWGVDLR
ncbi:MAG: NAD(+)/NADH kinase [Alistipes sp.]|nr:NAD(+)/NADH kinase [Alistipes sp.]